MGVLLVQKMSPGAKMTLMAALFAVLTCGLLFGLVKFVELRLSGGKELAGVVVARQYIEKGAVISSDMLQPSQVVTSSLPKNAVRLKSDAVGKVAAADIAVGDMVFNQMLAESDNLGLAYQLADGQRAMTVKFNKVTGVDGLIHPGNRVDILVYLAGNDGKPGLEGTILQDVRVLAINKQLTGDATGLGAKGEEVEDLYVTLSLTLSQSQVIGLAQDSASLRLTLRPQQEDSLFTGKAAGLTDLLWVLKGTAPGTSTPQ